MTYPTPHTVQRLPWQSGGTDAHGNPIDGFGPPQDVAVYGWGAPTSEERNAAGDRVIVDVNLYAPPMLEVTSRDRFVIPVGPNAGTYTVEGEVADYTHGPFGWKPGVVVSLRRVEG